MAFWWPLLVLALAFAICKFLLILIPPKVPSIDVDASDVLDDGNQPPENSFIYVPPRGKAQQTSKKVQCYEPATMKYLGYVSALTPDEDIQVDVSAASFLVDSKTVTGSNMKPDMLYGLYSKGNVGN